MEKTFSLLDEISFVAIFNKVKESTNYLVLALILSAIVLTPAILAMSFYDMSYSMQMRDPVVLLGGPLYTGWFSQLGCALWFVSVGFCFLSLQLISKDHPMPRMRSFLIYSLALTTFLGVDDMFLLHDEILPYLGIKENLIALGYFMAVVVYLLLYFKVILKTQYVVLGLAFFFLGLSLSLDRLPGQKIFTPGAWQSVLIEDGAKMIGIILWAIYFYSVAKLTLKKKTMLKYLGVKNRPILIPESHNQKKSKLRDTPHREN